MALSTHELELSTTTSEKFQKENPKTWAHILHNWDAIKAILDAAAAAVDLSVLQAQVTALQVLVNALQAELDALVIPPPFDPSALQAAINDLQDQIDAIVIPIVPPPFQMPPGGQDHDVLMHGPGGDADFFWQSPCALVLAVPDGYQITDEVCGTVFVGL